MVEELTRVRDFAPKNGVDEHQVLLHYTTIGSRPKPHTPHTHTPHPLCCRYKQQILDAMESDDEKLAVDILFRAIQVRLWSRPT